MKIKLLAAVVILAHTAVLRAHEPITTKLTWTREISRIFNKRCVQCHRENGTAMPLTTYDEARPWAKAIRDEVLERRMPPWGAVKGFGEFRDDPSLTQPEIDYIVQWVEGGAPRGDDIYLPSPPVFIPPDEPHGKIADVEVRGELQLKKAVKAVSVRPKEIEPGGGLEVTAHLPDGRVRHLLWLRNYRPEWKRTFYFREPVVLPRGTRVLARPGTAIVGVGNRGR